ncbi:FecR family protein [Flavobacterium ardleyense]|uniref:FecR family protein n=1 Tax=Flavobacterium ardleyense TaxID=2038737 RepID=A0ABW5Z542_9FLAO
MDKAQAQILFSKYTNDQCSEEEIILLETFLDSYQGKDFDKSEVLKIQNSKDKVWKNILTAIETPPVQRKPNFFTSYTFYAVAASFLLFFSATFFLLTNNAAPDVETIVIAEQPILIGSDKALLTLENGETISLEKGKSFESKNANSNGESLVYQENDNKEKEVVYNYLTIPRGGQFFVQLSDGTKVWLNSESKLKFPVTFNSGQSRQVELVYGEAYFAVSSSKNHNGAHFNVITNKQNIEVLGTEFNIKAYQDEESIYTTLIEGKIEFQFKNNIQVLKPNEQIVLNLENEKTTSQLVAVQHEIAWKDGIFSFKGKNLKEIMKVLSRWYDVEVVFENKSIEHLSFKGVLGKEQSIEEILVAIKSASLINSYQIKNKTIYLK